MIGSDAPAMDAPAFLGAGMSNAALATRPGLILGPQPSATVLLLEIAIRTAKDVPAPFPPSVVEYLLVAGGGAGRGGPYGGGGGGGGVRSGNLSITPGSRRPITGQRHPIHPFKGGGGGLIRVVGAERMSKGISCRPHIHHSHSLTPSAVIMNPTPCRTGIHCCTLS